MTDESPTRTKEPAASRLPALLQQKRGLGLYVALGAAGVLVLVAGAFGLGLFEGERPPTPKPEATRPGGDPPRKPTATLTIPPPPVMPPAPPTISPTPSPAADTKPAADDPATTPPTPSPPAGTTPPAGATPPEPPPAAGGTPPGPSAPTTDPAAPPPGPTADKPPSEKPEGGKSPDEKVPPPAPAAALIAANGLAAPPPEKPPVPTRCPPLDPLVLTEQTPAGRLPRIDASGCMPWLAHAAVFDYREKRPRVGIIVLGLGKDPQLTQRAIDGLPARISLGFLPDAPLLDKWIEKARARGHEALVILPVQAPDKLPETTAPPLRADLAAAENMKRLQAVLARAGTGYIGVIVPMNTPLSSAEPALRPLLKEVSDRGLLVLETFRTSAVIYKLSKELGLPYSADAGWIDRKGEPGEIAANLQALEEFTKRNRFALAVGTAQRETIERLITWSKDLESRGMVLAPVTGLTECLELCAERVRKAVAGGSR